MKEEFSSKIGLIAATVGSAVGLGNVWRFPAEVQENGGAAFLLVYIACVFLLGIPVMMGEFAIGRAGRTDSVGAFKKIASRRPWWLIGSLGIIASYTILCFYMVVSGWTLEYFFQSVSGNLYAAVDGMAPGADAFTARMQDYVLSEWRPLIYTAIMIVANLVILLGGVRKGIERMSNILMPTLFILLLIFCGVALTLPDAMKGVEYFFSPDFSKITPSVIVNALGQAFFSLSLGLGILITYGSYFPASTNLGKTATTVALLDLGVAILMGLIIFPAVTSFGLDGESLQGVTLIFVTLPEVFARLWCPPLWSALFFLALTVAAITSTISLSEVTISLLIDRCKMRRRTATLIAVLPLFVFSSACSLSQSGWDWLSVAGMSLFDFLDTFSTNILLPVGALLICVFLNVGAPRGFMRREFTNDGTLHSRLVSYCIPLVKYVAPVLIFIVLISPLL